MPITNAIILPYYYKVLNLILKKLKLKLIITFWLK